MEQQMDQFGVFVDKGKHMDRLYDSLSLILNLLQIAQ